MQGANEVLCAGPVGVLSPAGWHGQQSLAGVATALTAVRWEHKRSRARHRSGSAQVTFC